MKNSLRLRLYGSVAVAGMLLSGVALADDFTIQNGETVTTTQTLDTPGDVGTVEAGGAIDVSGTGDARAIDGTADGVTVNNAGTASGTANDFGYGIFARSNNTITNSGAASGTAIGINGVGYGIKADILNTITNSGNVSGTGDTLGYGIRTTGGNTITNSGTVTGTSDNIGYGIWIANSNTITNSGTALGTATGSDSDGYGIHANGGNTITNSGTVIGQGGDLSIAVFLARSNNTLNLLRGTNLQGALDLGGTGSNTLNIGPGLNTAYTFVGDLPDSINVNGEPVGEAGNAVLQGNLLAVVDVTGFATTDEILTDVTRSITGAVEGHLEAQRACHHDHRVAMGDMLVTPVADLPAVEADCGTGMWGTIFGGYSRLEGTHETSRLENGFGGVMVGYDTTLSEATVGGVFAVFAKGEAITPNDNYSNDMTSGFGGAYVSHAAGPVFLDLSVMAGVTNNDQDRLVNNNQVAGGLEVAAADYDGIAFSPSLRMSFEQGLGGSTLTPSVRVRYAGLYLDSYRETGSAVNLAVGDRDVHVVEVRGELALAIDSHEVESGFWHTQVKGGVDGIFNWGDDVDATLLGQDIRFAAGEEESIIRGYGGVEAAFTSHGGTQFTAAVEAGYDSVETISADARLGVHVPLDALY